MKTDIGNKMVNVSISRAAHGAIRLAAAKKDITAIEMLALLANAKLKVAANTSSLPKRKGKLGKSEKPVRVKILYKNRKAIKKLAILADVPMIQFIDYLVNAFYKKAMNNNTKRKTL